MFRFLSADPRAQLVPRSVRARRTNRLSCDTPERRANSIRSRSARRRNWAFETTTGCKAEIEIDGVLRRRLKVQAVEDILLVAMIVKNAELRSVQKPSGVQAVERKEVTPLVAAVSQVEAAVRPCQTIRTTWSPVPCAWIHSQARARGHHDHQAGLVAIFGGWRALESLPSIAPHPPESDSRRLCFADR